MLPAFQRPSENAYGTATIARSNRSRTVRYVSALVAGPRRGAL